MAKMMRAARLHKTGEPFQIDTIPVPEVRPTDVLVEVKAAGVVPNLRNVVTHYPTWFPFLPLPKLPAIYGLDSAGVVAEVGSQVRADIKPGDRVYVNPGLSCGSCQACRRNDPINCTAYTFQGYFGFGPGSQQIYEDYPYGGFGQYLTAPARNLVKLPDSISFEQGARFGYIGTSYSALRKAQFVARADGTDRRRHRHARSRRGDLRAGDGRGPHLRHRTQHRLARQAAQARPGAHRADRAR